MTTGPRVITSCQECGSRGKYRPLEVMVFARRAWQWSCLTLCAVCRLHVLQLHATGALASSPTKRLDAQLKGRRLRLPRWHLS